METETTEHQKLPMVYGEEDDEAWPKESRDR